MIASKSSKLEITWSKGDQKQIDNHLKMIHRLWILKITKEKDLNKSNYLPPVYLVKIRKMEIKTTRYLIKRKILSNQFFKVVSKTNLKEPYHQKTWWAFKRPKINKRRLRLESLKNPRKHFNHLLYWNSKQTIQESEKRLINTVNLDPILRKYLQEFRRALLQK